MNGRARLRDHRSTMKRIARRKRIGQEAPMVITPRDVIRLLERMTKTRRRTRREKRD